MSRLFALALVAVIASACGATPATAPAGAPTRTPLAPVRVAYTSISGNRLPLWLGVDKQIFERYGVKVEATFTSSSPNAMAELIGGHTDVLEGSGGEVVQAVAQGADLKVIGIVESTIAYQLWVKPNIKTPEDLKGKKVGVTRLGSSSYIFVKQMLQAMKIDKDVTIVATGELAATRAAFASDAIQGFADAPPNVLLPPEQIRRLGDPGALDVTADASLITVRGDYFGKNKDVLVKFLTGYAATLQYAYTNAEDAKASYKLNLKNDDAKFIEETYQTYVRAGAAGGGMPMDPSPSVKLIQKQKELQLLVNPEFKSGAVDPAKIVETGPMDAVKASAEWKAIWPTGIPASAQ